MTFRRFQEEGADGSRRDKDMNEPTTQGRPIKPTVSVVIPAYNRAPFIAAAVQSVLDQTFQDREIIVVDDGSTDQTQSMLLPFLEKIRYIGTEHHGPSHARNTGMKAATGKYIAFLDSDDLYLPHKLEAQVSFLESHPDVGMVCTEASAFNENGIFEERHLRTAHTIYRRRGLSYHDIFPVRGEFAVEGMKETIPYYSGNIFKFVLMGPLVFSPTILFQRKILDQIGYQNEAYWMGEEYEFVVRICKRYPAAFLDIPAYLIRYHSHQISLVRQERTRKKILTELESEKTLLQAVLDWGYSDKEYYAKNQEWLNPRVSELYHCIGEKWFDLGDSKKARESFKKGLSFNPASRENLTCWWLSYLPSVGRRIFWGVSHRIRKWAY